MHGSRWWIFVAGLLAGCTTTRTLASFDGLERGGHSRGFALPTTEALRSRIDANSTLYLQSKQGVWTSAVPARDAYADENGLWLQYDDVAMWKVLDRVELEGADPILGTLIAATQPHGATLIHAMGSGRYDLQGEHDQVRRWLRDLQTRISESASTPLRAPLLSIRGTNHQGYVRTLNNTTLEEFLDLSASAKYGWLWDDVNAVQVESLSAPKTFGASILIGAAAVALAPLALLGGGGGGSLFPSRLRGPHGGGGGPHISGAQVGLQVVGALAEGGSKHTGPSPTEFEDTLAPVPVASASRMFTTAARVHSIIRGTLALDSSVAFAGDHLGTGLIAKVRFGEMFELGAGAREVATRDAMGWHASTTPVLAFNWHIALDANDRFAIPIGFEGSWGGEVAHDVRFPIGLRYTTPSGRYFGTLYPATPQHMRVESEKNGRWSYATSVEIGVTF